MKEQCATTNRSEGRKEGRKEPPARDAQQESSIDRSFTSSSLPHGDLSVAPGAPCQSTYYTGSWAAGALTEPQRCGSQLLRYRVVWALLHDDAVAVCTTRAARLLSLALSLTHVILGTASVLFERRTLLQRLLPVELRVRQQPHALLPSARHGLRLVHLPRTRGAARCSALGSASDDSAAPWRGHQNFCCGQCNCCQQGQLCSFDGACTQNVLQTVITVSVLVSVGSFLTMIFVPIVTRLYLVRHYNARTSCDHRALLAAWHPAPSHSRTRMYAWRRRRPP